MIGKPEKWRETIYKNDQIVGDSPAYKLQIGFDWNVWRTKAGRWVIITEWDDDQGKGGYQLITNDAPKVESTIRAHLRIVNSINEMELGRKSNDQ